MSDMILFPGDRLWQPRPRRGTCRLRVFAAAACPGNGYRCHGEIVRRAEGGPSLERGGLNLWTKNILYRFVVYTGVLTLYIHQNLQRCILLLDSLN